MPHGANSPVSVALACALLVATSVATACESSNEATTADGKTVLRYQGQASQVTYTELAENLGYFDDVTLQWVGDTTSGPQDIQSAATGKTDFGGAFNGAIVKLAAGGAPITSVVGYYGSDPSTYTGYYVLDDSPISSARDLIGVTVGMNTLDAHHEFVVREWLAQQRVTPDEIKQVALVVVPPVNTETALRQGQIDVGTLAFVFRETAIERGGIRPLFTDESLFGAFTYGSYVYRNDYFAQNEDAVADFVQGTARAIRWAQTTPTDDVITKYREIIGARGRNENTDLVGYWRSTGITGPGGVIDDRKIALWIDWLVRNGELSEASSTPVTCTPTSSTRMRTGRSRPIPVPTDRLRRNEQSRNERESETTDRAVKQRVAIARSLAFDPEVLLMDEPFAALTPRRGSLCRTSCYGSGGRPARPPCSSPTVSTRRSTSANESRC